MTSKTTPQATSQTTPQATSLAGHRHKPTRVEDRGRLAVDLARAVRGEVRFDRGSQALYANDASVFRQVPIGVVIPRDADDVLAALAVCRDHDVPVLARGCGTGLAGQSVNAAVVFDFSKYMHQIVSLDAKTRTARVQPGVICDQLRGAAAEHGLTFSVDPATHDRCTLGGMIGNNSCGTHSVMGGKTVDNVLELDVVTYDGTRMTVGPTSPQEYERIVAGGGRQAEIYQALKALAERYEPLIRDKFPEVPRRVSGYNLPDLLPDKEFNLARALTGTESTCVLVLEAKVRLLPDPPHHALLVVGYADAAAAADHVPALLQTQGLIGLIECVTDEHEPPYPAKITKDQVKKLTSALREGTPNRRRIALQMVRDLLDESSFDASPAHAVPGPVARTAAKVAGKLHGDDH